MFRLFALTGTAVSALLAVLLTSPPHCQVRVQQTSTNPDLNQIRLTAQVKPGCPANAQAVIRFRTVNDGVVPFSGYILRGTYPTQYSFWLTRTGASGGRPSVEQKIGSVWRTIWRLGQ